MSSQHTICEFLASIWLETFAFALHLIFFFFEKVCQDIQNIFGLFHVVFAS
jgi:hypothetical protein